jgi:hypothetical protein
MFILMVSKLLYLYLIYSITAQLQYFDREIYQGIIATPCTLLLTPKGLLGCTAGPNGAAGILFVASTTDELNNFLDSPPCTACSLVIPNILFKKESSERIIKNTAVKGLILIKNEGVQNYSPDSTSPNLEFGLYANDSNPHQWNPNGLDLLSKSFHIPIFEISASQSNSTAALLEAAEYNKSNQSTNNRLYSVEFRADMFAVKDAATCLGRKHCDPIGEKSVWSTFSTNLSRNDSKPIIFLSSAFDSNSIFREVSYGDSRKAGSILLLGIADALSKVKLV